MIDLRLGDAIEQLRLLDDASVHAVVTDPPYGLSFMGKHWDYDVPSVEIWRECLRVLKPGGHLLAFAGTRTQHRMAVNIEDAGFEIRDMIAWVYGSGFPKSLDVSKAIDKAAGAEREVVGSYKATGTARTMTGGNYGGGGNNVTERDRIYQTAPATEAARQWEGWGTALKPAMEPITVARKPLCGTVAENVLRHGTGAINVDGCRVEPTGESRARIGEASQDRRYTERGGTNLAAMPGVRGGDPNGRWPGNLIHDGSDEVVGLNPNSRPNMVRVEAAVLSPRVDAPITAPATDAARQWAGWGTALKPAREPITVARKPLCGTVAENVLRHGTGGINVDGCRVGTEERPHIERRNDRALDGEVYGSGINGSRSLGTFSQGRWPANLIHDGSDEVVGLFPQGDSGSAARFFYTAKAGRSERFAHLTCNCETVKLCAWVKQDQSHDVRTDTTSPEQDTFEVTTADDSPCNMSLFGSESTAPSPKGTPSTTSTATSKTTGLTTSNSSRRLSTSDSTEDPNSARGNGSSRVVFAGDCFQSLPSTSICPPKDGRFTGVVVGATSPLSSGISKCEGCGSEIRKTSHPTQKPESLMRYLCRLVTPPNGIVLDPFMGSGSTGKACALEGFQFIGIEREPEYVEIARARIGAVAPLFAGGS